MGFIISIQLIYDGFCTASKPLTETENNDD